MGSETRIILIYIIQFIFFSSLNADVCKIGDIDLSPLQRVPWVVKTTNGSQVTDYKINICGEVKGSSCPASTSVCKTSGQQAVSIGDLTSSLVYHETPNRREVVLNLTGSPCTEVPGQHMKTFIILKCGKTLGSPVLLDSHLCDTYFEWHTTAACKGNHSEAEEPCYIYDSNNQKHDLSALIKLKGGYQVNKASRTYQFYINICRDITPDASTQGCGGTGSCYIVDGKAYGMGRPQDGLKFSSDGEMMLHYRSEQTPEICAKSPTTTIKFTCPKRGGGKDPELVSDADCGYVINWVTEAACHEDFLTSKTCILSKEQHDVDFDLTPLKHLPTQPYYARDETKFDYYLNVCGDSMEVQCPNETSFTDNTLGCQAVHGDQNNAHVIGRKTHQELRYSDGQLTLTYRGGDPCRSGFQREMIITFTCNRTAGAGSPVFDTESEEGCTYMFDWDTEYACLDHPKQCRADFGSNRFDLSVLIRETGDNWEAVRAGQHDEQDESQYFINVCNDVLRQGEAARCPEKSAVCMIPKNGPPQSLGSYSQTPVYLSNNVVMNYTDGDSCGTGGKKHSIITFICRPGDLQSAPTLIRKSPDQCLYEFEWQTAAACVLGRKLGANCKVDDDDAGFNFDLSRLKLTGEKAFYNVSHGGHDYFINVCAKVTGTKCDEGTHSNAGVCQVEHGSQNVQYWNLGEPSMSLSYYDGLINLTYSNGDAYRSHPPRPRTTEIAFLCDLDAGTGSPKYVQETEVSYVFEWKTKYACPEVPIECLATDEATGKQYDLSSLAKAENGGNWATRDEKNQSLILKFYINVCRPLNTVSVGAGCDTTAAACMTTITSGQERISIPNMGQAKESPKVLQTSDGPDIMIEYVNGGECTLSNGTKTKYHTKIHFICKKGDLTTGPSSYQVDRCTYIFRWETEAACDIKDTQGGIVEPCAVKDPNSEYIFNLLPLQKREGGYYWVSGGPGGKSFMVNVCGNLSTQLSGCQGVAGCLVSRQTNTGTSLGAYYVNTTLPEYSEDGQLKLTYYGPRDVSTGMDTTMEINFKCNKSVSLGEPVFSKKSGSKYIFNFHTSLACPPAPVECSVYDHHGNMYDLNPLSKVTGNWQAIDTTRENVYYINICRPINTFPGSQCPGGPVGGCVVKQNGSFSTGYIQSKPEVAVDGSITVRYMGGSLCHVGKENQHHRSTRIIFSCAEKEHGPVFQSRSYCEYLFTWNTPAACPVRRVTGENCAVSDPLYHYPYTLNSLKNSTTPYNVSAGGDWFLINVCDDIKKGAANCDPGRHVGSCQVEGQHGTSHSSFNAGIANGKLIYEDGMMSLKYTGGDGGCHGSYNRSTVIKFFCDHSTSGVAEGPTFIERTEDCTYMFEWRTSFACALFSVIDCSYQDDQNNQYDLSSLTMARGNYNVTDSASPTKKFIINICSTVVHEKGVMCPLRSAACLVNLDERNYTNRYHNLGEAAQNPFSMVNNRLTLTYSNGEPCSLGSGGYSKTIITFECDHSAIDTNPVYTLTENCEYHFMWRTSAACPVKGSTTRNNCTAVNPVTGYTFDFHSLKKDTGYRVSDARGHSLDINICSPLKHAPSSCGERSGSCKTEVTNERHSYNNGIANAMLRYDDGVLTLNYSGGDTCQKTEQPRQTIISFVCGAPGSGTGTPEYVADDEECIYYIGWHTELACEKQVQCTVDTDQGTIDLSPLIKASGYHLAINTAINSKDPGAAFYINVCRPLNPVQGTLCPAGASACRVKAGETPVGLGKSRTPPTLDTSSGKVTLIYDHGNMCTTNNAKNISSRVIFECQQGSEQGQPYLEDVTDCEYIFVWRTSVICQEDNPVVHNECSFYDSKTKHTFDFSSLRKTSSDSQGYYQVSDYKINVCGPLYGAPNSCSGAGVCKTDNFIFGSAESSSITYEDGQFKLTYTDGGTCSSSASGKASAQVIFECDRASGTGQPEYLTRSACDVAFTWKTALACPPVQEECFLTHQGSVYDLRLLSRETGSWEVMDAQGNMYWLNICQEIHSGQGQCSSDAAACRKLKDGTIDSLGSVITQQLKMEDDGSTLVLRYTGGNNACGHGSRRSDNLPASTVIKFQCGSTVGGPVLIPRDDHNSCEFEFHWKTSIACKEDVESVTIKDGIIYHPRTQGVIDLRNISKKYYYADELRGTDHYRYMIDLGTGEAVNNVPQCKGAAVCQTKVGAQFFRHLGTMNNSKFYIEDDVLEMIMESPSACGKDNSKTVRTIIDFYCSDNWGEPKFDFESHSCEYLFDWGSPAACVKFDVVNPTPMPTDDGGSQGGLPSAQGGPPSASTIGAIVATFLGVIVLCLLVIYFHSQERRSSFKARVKTCFGRSTVPNYQYSVLNQGDEDLFEELVRDLSETGEEEVNIMRSASTKKKYDEELLTDTRNISTSYHDESDDEILT